MLYLDLTLRDIQCAQQPFVIGRRGTAGVLTVRIDYSAWVQAYGAGIITLMVKPYGASAAYPVVLEQTGSLAAWQVSIVDTQTAGVGQAELLYHPDNSSLDKSAVFAVAVLPDIGRPLSELPDAYEDWVSRLEQLGAETQQDAQDAAQSAEAAAESAASAAESETNANQRATDAETARAAAQASAASARSDAQTVAADKAAAQTAAQSAEISQTNAAGAAIQAGESADAAEQSATEAGNAQAAAEAAQEEAEAARSETESARDTAVATLQTEGAAQRAAIQQKGAEVLAELQNYADLPEDVADLKSAFAEIIETVTSSNHFNPSEVVPGEFIAPNGTPGTSASYNHTGFINVSPGDIVRLFSKAGTQYNMRFICAYNINKQPITDKGINNPSGVPRYDVPDEIFYIKISYLSTYGNELYVTLNSLFESYEPYFEPYPSVKGLPELEEKVNANTRNKIRINASDGINGFYSKMTEAVNLGNCDVYIGRGTYTYTNEFIDNLRQQNIRGVPIGSGCNYFFESAKLICEYTGENTTDVNGMFSVLDCQSSPGNYELHNAIIEAKNILYCVHDESVGGDWFVSHKYFNCHIMLDNTAMGSGGNIYSKCIGGGLARYEEIIIKDCIFDLINPAPQNPQDVTYHGAAYSNFCSDANIIITGCKFSHQFRGSNLAANVQAPYPTVIYTNNKALAGAVVDTGWTLNAWNNINS